MEEKQQKTSQQLAPVNITDDAVGVPESVENVASEQLTSDEKRWFVAIVKPRTEKKCSDSLKLRGYETYVATQIEERKWSQGRKKKIERIVIPSMVFVRTTEEDRLKDVAYNPYVARFLTDKASRNKFGRALPAIVPDRDIAKLQFILRAADTPVTVEQRHITVGTKVRVMRGPLIDTTGIVLRHTPGDTYLYIELDILGCVKVKIDLTDLKVLE